MKTEEEATGIQSRRGGKGRRRIEIKKILDSKTALIVTFSKRRNGLFKKATELHNLCGVEAAVVAFSPSGRPYSTGNPSSESVVLRYLNGRLTAALAAADQEEAGERLCWWEKGIEDLKTEEEVKEFKDALIELKRNLVYRIEEFKMRCASTPILFS
ncbi:agamous-like MADS-box protein AGL61 [Mercurialis annua]|uniref:agamous-like MADS-box protein AGL61 n=1 Tax=Mercurialis annua TaxID=3986 RepID=UPI00216053B2|nr:agamous-like MADS-box protein AGL61 [Mercurialis annua]